MVERKGVGYLVEGFASVLIILVFVFSTFFSMTAETEDWTGYRTEISASDLENSALEAGQLSNFIVTGSAPRLSEYYSDISGNELEASTTFSSTSGQLVSVGVYVPSSGRETLTMQEVKSPADRCNNELDELRHESSSGNILRSKGGGGSIEDEVGARLYLVDADPRNGSGFNGEVDYDSVYVDNGTKCVFGPSEGPHRMDKMFMWGDHANNGNESYFEVQSVENPSGKPTLYRMDLPAQIREAVQRAEFRRSTVVFDGVNMTQDWDHDMLFFHGDQTLPVLESNEAKVDFFLREGSVILASEIDYSEFSTNTFLNDTGMNWVNLSAPSTGEAGFTSDVRSQEMSAYFNSIGCYSCRTVTLEDESKITASDSQYIAPDSQVLRSSSSYNTNQWDASDTLSDDNPNVNLNAVPNSVCSSDGGPHWNGTVSLPNTTRYYDHRVVVTQLGQVSSYCSREDYALNLDYDADGNLDGSNDRESNEILNNSLITVHKRFYRVRIYKLSSDDIKLDLKYAGGDSVSFVNYVESFEDQDIESFSRMPDLMDSGSLGGRDEEETVLAGALILMASDAGEAEVSNPSINTRTSGLTEGVPFSIRTRWSR